MESPGLWQRIISGQLLAVPSGVLVAAASLLLPTLQPRHEKRLPSRSSLVVASGISMAAASFSLPLSHRQRERNETIGVRGLLYLECPFHLGV